MISKYILMRHLIGADSLCPKLCLEHRLLMAAFKEASPGILVGKGRQGPKAARDCLPSSAAATAPLSGRHFPCQEETEPKLAGD